MHTPNQPPHSTPLAVSFYLMATVPVFALALSRAIEHLFAGACAEQRLLGVLRFAVAALLSKPQHFAQRRVHVLGEEGARVDQGLHDLTNDVVERFGHGVAFVVPDGIRSTAQNHLRRKGSAVEHSTCTHARRGQPLAGRPAAHGQPEISRIIKTQEREGSKQQTSESLEPANGERRTAPWCGPGGTLDTSLEKFEPELNCTHTQSKQRRQFNLFQDTRKINKIESQKTDWS